MQKHGYWKEDGPYQYCSVCHRATIMPYLKGLLRFEFCPYCGAKMDGESKGIYSERGTDNG